MTKPWPEENDFRSIADRATWRMVRPMRRFRSSAIVVHRLVSTSRGDMPAAMGRLDVLAFAEGIGEHGDFRTHCASGSSALSPSTSGVEPTPHNRCVSARLSGGGAGSRVAYVIRRAGRSGSPAGSLGLLAD